MKFYKSNGLFGMLFGLIMLFFLSACSHSNGPEKSFEPEAYVNMQDRAEAQLTEEREMEDAETGQMERMLIKRGNLSLEVSNLDDAEQKIRQFIQSKQGYISNESAYTNDYRQQRSYELRMPSQSFDQAVEQISSWAKNIESRSISSEDVTEQFIDVQSRMKTKKALEVRYIDILSKANNVTEMLEVERQLNNVRADIESMEGRLKYLKNQTSYSTLSLTIFTKTSRGFGGRFGDALENGWELLKDFLITLTTLWPFLLLAVLLIAFIRSLRRRRRKN